MRFIVLITLITTSFFCFGQNKMKSLAIEIDAKVKSSEYQLDYLPDSVLQYACSALIYFDKSGLHKLEAGCGDVSLEMTHRYYYFSQGELVYAVLEIHKFNAPPTFTEEVAKKEGVENWFDPAKTKISRVETFFTKGKMTRMIDNGKDVPSSYAEFEKTETVVLGAAKQGKDHYNIIKQ